jgi:hypothetical protein
MRIVMHVTAAEDRRLTGTAWSPDGRRTLPFSGAMELLAAIESLCFEDDRYAVNQSDDEGKEACDD